MFDPRAFWKSYKKKNVQKKREEINDLQGCGVDLCSSIGSLFDSMINFDERQNARHMTATTTTTTTRAMRRTNTRNCVRNHLFSINLACLINIMTDSRNGSLFLSSLSLFSVCARV